MYRLSLFLLVRKYFWYHLSIMNTQPEQTGEEWVEIGDGTFVIEKDTDSSLLGTLPEKETNEHKEERVAEAEMLALEHPTTIRFDSALQEGFGTEHQTQYIGAKQRIFVLRSDIEELKTYVQELRTRKEQTVKLKEKGVYDFFEKSIKEEEDQAIEEMKQKKIEMQSLERAVEQFEQAYDKAVKERSTTTAEAMKEAAEDLFESGVIITKKAAKTTAGAVGLAGTTTMKGVKKTNHIGGAGAYYGGLFGAGFIVATFVGVTTFFKELFGIKPNKKE